MMVSDAKVGGSGGNDRVGMSRSREGYPVVEGLEFTMEIDRNCEPVVLHFLARVEYEVIDAYFKSLLMSCLYHSKNELENLSD